MTYGQLNWLETAPRYTSLAEVKDALGITDTSNDTEITQAIVAAETQLDVYMGRSLPDPAGGPIEGIPEAVKVAALVESLAVYKLRDGVFGQAGSDEFIGDLDVDDIVKSRRARDLLTGLRVSFGFS